MEGLLIWIGIELLEGIGVIIALGIFFNLPIPLQAITTGAIIVYWQPSIATLAAIAVVAFGLHVWETEKKERR
jgi:hypothetical protein